MQAHRDRSGYRSSHDQQIHSALPESLGDIGFDSTHLQCFCLLQPSQCGSDLINSGFAFQTANMGPGSALCDGPIQDCKLYPPGPVSRRFCVGALKRRREGSLSWTYSHPCQLQLQQHRLRVAAEKQEKDYSMQDPQAPAPPKRSISASNN